jgi:hypothetical protein
VRYKISFKDVLKVEPNFKLLKKREFLYFILKFNCAKDAKAIIFAQAKLK